MYAVIDWLFHSGLYLLCVTMIAGVALLICSGVWGDRSRGRPRCPKCWYDMRGSMPRLECPECGHDAKQERRLYRNRRGWRRIALGIVLVLVLSYPATVASGWYREQSSILKLTKHGHQVISSLRTGPEWFVGRLPERFARLYDRVEHVWFDRSGTDADLAECGKLWRLETIEIINGPLVTDKGVEHLKGLVHLEFLSLMSTRVTDTGLEYLRGLSQLQSLCLFDTQVTDAGLVHLKGLSRLDRLSLAKTQVTDAGLVHLKVLFRLQHLSLSDTQVTNDGVLELKEALPGIVVTRQR